MKNIGLLILIAFIIGGCSSKPKTTCNLVGYITSSSSTTWDCKRVNLKFSDLDPGTEKLPKDQLLFVEYAYKQLSEEASQGYGENLTTLSQLLSCENSELLSQKLQSHYSTVFYSESIPANSLQKIHLLLKSDQLLRSSCSKTSEI